MAKSSFRSAQEIFNELSRQSPSFRGLIRAVEGRDDQIDFSMGKTAADWMAISVKDIESVDGISSVQIGEVNYHYVGLRLRTPPQGLGLIYARLAGAPVYDVRPGSKMANNLFSEERVESHVTGRCWDSERHEWYDCPPYRES